MNTEFHNLIPGSPEWMAFRREHDGASEAAAMLGLSLTTTRNEMLRMKHSGVAKEFDAWVQRNILDHGHKVEALAKPHAVKIIGQSLYSVTCSIGRTSASCDGLTVEGRVAWEHKQWNARIAAIVRGGEVPEEHLPQCMQVLFVTKAEKLVFMVSDGTPENMVWVEVLPDLEWFERLESGWLQFNKDRAVFVPVEAEPVLVGKAIEVLPALLLTIKGEVSESNLDYFKEVALSAIRSVNRVLKTEQDFADSAKARQWCSSIETRVAAAKDHAMSQTQSIDLAFKALDAISAEAAEVRISLEKLEKARTITINEETINDGRNAFDDHIAGLNAAMPMPFMPRIFADFPAQIKGLRSITAKQNAVATELARLKIEADKIAAIIQSNWRFLTEKPGMEFLFPDLSFIIQKAPDDFAALVKTRISEHTAAEAKRLEAEREKIRAEERAKAEKVVRDAEAARIAKEAEAVKAAQPAVVVPVALPVSVIKASPSNTVRAPVATTRAQINAHLEDLSEPDLLRVLSFLRSRYPAAVAA